MKSITIILLGVLLATAEIFSQGHIAPCAGSQDHTGGICYGYATGRAAGRSAGDPNCNPLTFYQDPISTNFFDYYSDANLTGLQPGDIVRFSDHAAYVISVGSPVGNSRVDQYSTMRQREETNQLLEDVRREFGNWTGYYRNKLVNVTVQNSFSGGAVKIDGATVNAGTHALSWWGGQRMLEAVNRQNILDPSNNTYYVRVFQQWSTPDGPMTSISIGMTPRPGQTYRAEFDREFNITFQNNLPGANGGQIKVNGSTYSAPHTAQVLQTNPSITGEALYQVISGIEYTFSSWSPGGSTSASTIFYPGDHTTCTASFSAKPQPPPGVSAGGSVGSYVQVTWSDHPHQQVTQYQIWRKVKQQGDIPTLLTTVSRGTTSFTDYDYKITDGYTHDLVSYDVRSYFSVNASYSDPNWVPVFARQDISAERGVGEAEQAADLAAVPMEYSLGSYPNPFNPSTTIRYTLLQNARVQVGIFDLMGREITRLVDTEKNAGMYQVVWHGVDERGEILPSGIYLVRMSAESTNGRERFAKTMKIVMMK